MAVYRKEPGVIPQKVNDILKERNAASARLFKRIENTVSTTKILNRTSKK